MGYDGNPVLSVRLDGKQIAAIDAILRREGGVSRSRTGKKSAGVIGGRAAWVRKLIDVELARREREKGRSPNQSSLPSPT